MHAGVTERPRGTKELPQRDARALRIVAEADEAIAAQSSLSLCRAIPFDRTPLLHSCTQVFDILKCGASLQVLGCDNRGGLCTAPKTTRPWQRRLFALLQPRCIGCVVVSGRESWCKFLHPSARGLTQLVCQPPERCIVAEAALCAGTLNFLYRADAGMTGTGEPRADLSLELQASVMRADREGEQLSQRSMSQEMNTIRTKAMRLPTAGSAAVPPAPSGVRPQAQAEVWHVRDAELFALPMCRHLLPSLNMLHSLILCCWSTPPRLRRGDVSRASLQACA